MDQGGIDGELDPSWISRPLSLVGRCYSLPRGFWAANPKERPLMAKLKANVRPRRCKRDTRVFKGTCSNCRDKKVDVTKVKGSQVCMDKCLSGLIMDRPKVSDPGILQILKDGVLGTS